MRDKAMQLGRFFTKFVHDVLPAALASLVGGFLLTHFGVGRAPEPPAVQATPASPEMMSLLRDEHALVVNFVNAQVANEKKQLAAADAASRAAAEAQSTAAAPTPRTATVALAAVKPVAPRERATIVGASLPPLVIAQAQHDEAASQPVARNDDSLFAKTIGIKDHVIAVTQRAVSVISGIPSWIGSIGDRIGGENANPPRPPADLVSAS